MDYKEIYESWLANPYFDEETKAELKAIADDDNEIKERFYQELEFGTAGLRGVIGAGTNRMENSHRALLSHTIHAICHLSLQMKQHSALQPMELKHMYLSHSDLHLNFRML